MKFRGPLKNNSAKAIMVALIRVHENGCLLLRTFEKEKKSREKKKEERSLSLKFHALLKTYSAKAIMVALIWVHEKGCLLLGTG